MENQPTAPVLIEVTRGPEVESRHRGQIVVIDAQGKLEASSGRPGSPGLPALPGQALSGPGRGDQRGG